LEKRKALARLEEIDPARKEKRLEENQPRTIENTKEVDPTLPEAEDEEVLLDEATDEFSSYFTSGMQFSLSIITDSDPKILITTSRRASANVYDFASEFVTIFPNAQFVKRGSQFEVKKIVEIAIKREFTDVIIINEDNKKASMFFLQLTIRCSDRDSSTRRPNRYIQTLQHNDKQSY
jgi:ribosome production factor 1